MLLKNLKKIRKDKKYPLSYEGAKSNQFRREQIQTETNKTIAVITLFTAHEKERRMIQIDTIL